MFSYPHLNRDFGWKIGVYRSPKGYEHPWICVTRLGTTGHWSREEARMEFRRAQAGVSEESLRSALNDQAELEFWNEIAEEFTPKNRGK